MHSHAEFGGHAGPAVMMARRWVNTPTAATLVGMGLLANLAAGTPALPLALAIISIAFMLQAGLAPRTLLRRLTVPWYLATVAALTQIFLVGSTPLFVAGPITAHVEGLARGLILASKVLGGGALVLTLTLTTPPTEILGLAARLRLPTIIVEIALLTYRYLFLLAEEAQRIREAQRVRLGHADWRRSIAAAGNLAGMVMVNAYDRAERAYQAMLVRGYAGASLSGANTGNEALHWPPTIGAAILLAAGLWAGGLG